MKKLKHIIILTLLWAFLGCSSDDPNNPVDPGPPNDNVVLANVDLVRQAAEAWAAMDPNGEFPADLQTAAPGGQTLIDLLPNGERLVNPYTGERTEPQDGLASAAGEVGYQRVEFGGAGSSYNINGWGESEELTRIDNRDDLDARTIEIGEMIAAAAEAFAADNNGLYPDDTGADQSETGKTLTDYLPDGRLIVNPFTLAATNPVDGASANWGEIGYISTSYGGYNLGYRVNATGAENLEIWEHVVEEANVLDRQVLVNCYKTWEAARQFALDNGDEYPDDIGTDTTPKGDTLVDLLGGVLLMNPYTQANTEPQTVEAAIAGETGYLPISDNGRNVGYRITGHGANNNIIVLTNE